MMVSCSKISHLTGEHRLRSKAGESAMGLDPSDSFGTDLSMRSHPDVMERGESKGTPEWPLSDDVGQIFKRLLANTSFPIVLNGILLHRWGA